MTAPVEEVLCAAYLTGQCGPGSECGAIHHERPYLWQACLNPGGWTALSWDGAELEHAYSQPGVVGYKSEIPLTYGDGDKATIPIEIDFERMLAQLHHPTNRWSEQNFMNIRRLSTPSYATSGMGSAVENEPSLASCPWRWYYDDGPGWKLFEVDGISPMQWVLEAKFLSGQKIYRFEADIPSETAKSEVIVFLLNFASGKMINLHNHSDCMVRRRPLFVSPDHCLLRKFPALPPTKPIAGDISEFPETWFPVDQKADYELVPLHPESMDYHLVASEFVKSGLPDWKILDIYRLQNPYLWNRFCSKKRHMELKSNNANELLLFHGTSADTSVQAIFRQNFDWRLNGKNATIHGDGSYFAQEASLSDKYTGGAHVTKVRWMFLARVLVGKYTKGSKGLKRPPPLDSSKPHGDLYDSCVNDISSPKIYVVFESDQSYPEYVISYNR